MLSKRIQSIIFLLLVGLRSAAEGQISTGGNFAVEQSVTANGGGFIGGGNFTLNGTTAQSVVGTHSTSGDFRVRGGFWQQSFVPTAALVSVSGRVTEFRGSPISKATISLIDAAGITRFALTNSFGYYDLYDVEVGQTYILSVVHKRHAFSNGVRTIAVMDELTDINFTADL